MKIIDQFINFCSYYHENEEKCRHCDFILSPRFVYAQNLIDFPNFEDLETFCRQNVKKFYYLSCFLKSLACVKRERLKIERVFNETLKLWSSTNIIGKED